MCLFLQTLRQRSSLQSVLSMGNKDGKQKRKDESEAIGAGQEAGKGENAPEEVTGSQLLSLCCLNKTAA